ncbi:hypothetical protein AC739_17245 [Planococcus glaciei]|nr:hypothetical protein AC739_17245 [Planococcus glaciei]
MRFLIENGAGVNTLSTFFCGSISGFLISIDVMPVSIDVSRLSTGFFQLSIDVMHIKEFEMLF